VAGERDGGPKQRTELTDDASSQTRYLPAMAIARHGGEVFALTYDLTGEVVEATGSVHEAMHRCRPPDIAEGYVPWRA
jgi:hypothetical protein